MKKTSEGEMLNLVSPKGKRIITIDELKELHNIGEEYELIKLTANKRDVAMNKKDGSTEIVELHQIKADFRPKHILLTKSYQDIIREVFASATPTVSGPKYSEGEKLLNINRADLHYGRLEEKKPEKYLQNLYDKNMYVFEKGLRDKPDKLIVGDIGDNMNSELNGITSSGKTPQENGMSTAKMFKDILAFKKKLIETFASEIEVDYLNIGGNHDRSVSQVMSDVLEVYFQNTDNVTIDNSEATRKYRKRGKVNLGFSHGDLEKEKDLLSVFANEIGLNKYNYHTRGHFHNESVKQYGNLILHTLSTPATPSSREKHNFTHTDGKIVGKLYDKKDGLISQYYK